MIDSNDRERVSEAREELQRMLNEDELRDALLLVFANKQDLPNAMNAAEITDKLGLHGLRQRTWYIQASDTLLPRCVYLTCLSLGCLCHIWGRSLRGSRMAEREHQAPGVTGSYPVVDWIAWFCVTILRYRKLMQPAHTFSFSTY